MKKYIGLGLILVCLFVFIPSVSAITINDYKNDLNALKQKKKNAQDNAAKIQAELNAAKEKIHEISLKMIEKENEQTKKEEEIAELEVKIAEKEQQIKDLVSFSQISNSENFYLKYIFGAESFTDFIYRFSVVEQLTERSNELTKEMAQLIKDNEAKIKELEEDKKELEKLEGEIKVQMAKLDDQKTTYSEEGETYDEQIASLEKQIKQFRSYGCKDNEDLSVCIVTSPEDSSYIKPLKHGMVTDNYGARVSPCKGCSSFHKGMDLAASEGTPIYAVAAGRIAYITYLSCGGNVVRINHIVNGRYVTTSYMHLLSYSVKVGDIVTQGQQIGQVGGGPRARDNCTTGAHLHFEVADGHYYGTSSSYSYTSYSTYLNKIFDPRKIIWFPAYGARW